MTINRMKWMYLSKWFQLITLQVIDNGPYKLLDRLYPALGSCRHFLLSSILSLHIWVIKSFKNHPQSLGRIRAWHNSQVCCLTSTETYMMLTDLDGLTRRPLAV
jgi:hypothetical protein